MLRFLIRNPSVTALVLIIPASLLDATTRSGDDGTPQGILSAAVALALAGHRRGKKQSTAAVSSVATNRPPNINITRHNSTAAAPAAGDPFCTPSGRCTRFLAAG